jgi:hypothetical protein
MFIIVTFYRGSIEPCEGPSAQRRSKLFDYDPSAIAVVAVTLARLAEAVLAAGLTLPVVTGRS